ncbi:30S ribosomal protein S7 [Candidatus Woesearchaeota archaeon]|nr:30S ribosomal protein S7 [Candidatus Woesearchaeota archaeon]
MPRKKKTNSKEETKKIKKKTKTKKKTLLKKPSTKLKIFDKWDANIEVHDPGLKNYITLSPVLVPYSAGRDSQKQFYKSNRNIVERLMSKLYVAGHKGKKHWRSSGHNTGKIATVYKIVKKTFEIIENKTKKNPIKVLVRAIEIGSPKEGTATIEYGGVKYPKATDLAPQRRIDLALRWMTQGAHQASASAGTKKSIWDALASEIIATADNDKTKSNCIKKKTELERQAAASR